jgi:hypothetical protein
MRSSLDTTYVQKILLEIKVEVNILEDSDRRTNGVGSNIDWNAHDKERENLLKYLTKNIF